MKPLHDAGLMETIIREVRDYSRKCFEGAMGSHDWEHTRRVHALCIRIGRVEGADLDVLELAAYLHDIGRSQQDQAMGSLCHAIRGAETARSLLEPLLGDRSMLDNIVHCIRSHRFRGDYAPQTLEAKVLFDADKLDSIGAVGVGRAFLFAGELGAALHDPEADPESSQPYTRQDTAYREYRLKLRKIKDRMLTREGRRLALKRHAFMEEFFNRFLEEAAGL